MHLSPHIASNEHATHVRDTMLLAYILGGLSQTVGH